MSSLLSSILLVGYIFLSGCLKNGGCELSMSVNGITKTNNSYYYVTDETADLIIRCKYDSGDQLPSLFMLYGDLSLKLAFQYEDSTLIYSVENSYKCDCRIYKCATSKSFFQVFVSYNTQCQVPTDPPPPSNGGRSNFTGLNPLIYTISAVILLGSLAIVAIITCWIRARRSFNNRSLRSAQTAQDYFDFLTDNEFTPLTTAEFQASLQERPPTYNQSEQIEANGGEVEEPDNTTTSPEPERTLPPREAAIIENLIALNLLPEDHQPSPRPRRARLAPGRTQLGPQTATNGTFSSQPQQTTSAQPSQQPVSGQQASRRSGEDSPEPEEGAEAVERLRAVGVRAQLMLNEQRSVAELVSIDPVQPSLECVEDPEPRAHPGTMEPDVGVFNSGFNPFSEVGLEGATQDTQ